jgi:cell cycle arrest protein BUB2
MSPERTSAEVYDQLAALLVPATPAGTRRSTSDVADGLKKIRRVVLTEGIPEVVSSMTKKPGAWEHVVQFG